MKVDDRPNHIRAVSQAQFLPKGRLNYTVFVQLQLSGLLNLKKKCDKKCLIARFALPKVLFLLYVFVLTFSSLTIFWKLNFPVYFYLYFLNEFFKSTCTFVHLTIFNVSVTIILHSTDCKRKPGNLTDFYLEKCV